MAERFLELGLFRRRKNDVDSPTVRLGKLLGRFLSLAGEFAIESESLKTSAFRSQLEQYRVRLEHVPNTTALETTVTECLALCQDYFRHAQKFLVERESEIREVVDVLREAVGTLTGGADTFNQRLMDSSVRFNRLTEIEDLRELKRQIAREVGELARIVAEKRKQDEVLYSKMSKRFDMLEDKLRETKQEVLLDPLTQVGNRRSLDTQIKRNLQELASKPLILAILDLDDFKRINDTYGHQVGDQALVWLARRLNSHIRATDYLGRYGGDEFVILLTGTTLPQAEIRFLQLLSNIASTPFEYLDGGETHSLRMTVSCGLAESVWREVPETLVRRADRALYEAKKRGKNCLVTSKG
jgi:diguanylate cyclase